MAIVTMIVVHQTHSGTFKISPPGLPVRARFGLRQGMPQVTEVSSDPLVRS
jgi:hypothetical protein